MSERNRRQRHHIVHLRRAHRGQSLVVALGVLFVLLFIGGIFVAQIARNLTSAGRAREVQDAQALAEAGIRYCQDRLLNSPEGADWRPVPTSPIVSPDDPGGLRDPDYYWLVELGGFQRIPQKGGRALVRVVYDPNPDDPNSHLLRIESIGRTGEISANDPTVFVNPQNGIAPRLRKELVAAVQLGLTDYSRFITNKNRSASEAQIGGVIGLPVATVIGDPNLGSTNGSGNGQHLVIGGGIRANTNLKFIGDVRVYLSQRGGSTPGMNPEAIQTTGQILTEPTRDVNGDNVVDGLDYQAFVNIPANANPDPLNPTNAIRPSTDANYSTIAGLVRDGATTPDFLGFTRSIPYLQPPVIDGYSSGSGVLRYRELTRDSGQWVTLGSGQRVNTGNYGWGRGIYIDNFDDLQKETTQPGLTGGYSLRADWLNPNNQFSKGYWQGPYYVPPGVQIELLGSRIRLTRSDGKRFRNPDGSLATLAGGSTIEIPLDDASRDNFTLPDGTAFPLPRLWKDGDEPGTGLFMDNNSYGVNVVLMAEGNVRVKGVLGAITNPAQGGAALSRVHLTIVTGGTAYIEGNIVKGDGCIHNGKVEAERGSTCAILAKDYVCVNTTMFMAPQNQSNFWNRIAGMDAFYSEVGSSRQTVDLGFSFGVGPNYYTTAGNPSPIYLMMRHAALAPGPSFINLLVNPAFGNSSYLFNQSPQLPPETYMLGLKYPPNSGIPGTDTRALTPNFEMRAFSLTGNVGNFTPVLNPGFDNIFRIQLDQTAAGQGAIGGYNLGVGGSTAYLLGGAMVAPLDIRIEAMLYAQEKSFFIIPGYPMNPDPDDTREAAGRTGLRKSQSQLDSPTEIEMKNLYPFYNEPTDVRITLYGPIAENYTASSSDQSAWMQRWGWIPGTYGSSNIPIPDDHLRAQDPDVYNRVVDPNPTNRPDLRTPQEAAANITRGIRYLYDPAFAMPYNTPTSVTLRTMGRGQRAQAALRAVVRPQIVSPFNGNIVIQRQVRQVLPPAPRLPVCPGFVYFGEPERRIDGVM